MNKIKNLLLYLFYPISSMYHENTITKEQLRLLSSKYKTIATQTK
jgi:hypothetical protein